MAAIMVMLKCLTNLHAGNGDVNYNIIDNEVERDPVTGYPNINSSGVKGALRQHLTKDSSVSADTVKTWFGEDAQGRLKVLGASLLAMPLRASSGNAAYYLVSTDEMQDSYKELYEVFSGGKADAGVAASWSANNNKSCKAEGIELKAVKKVDGKNVYRMELQDFAKMSLPVIARNKLNNGKSENLWYEEVLPHQSILYFPVIAEDTDKAMLAEFKKAIDGKVVQFGGNASIGYGLCKVSVKEL